MKFLSLNNSAPSSKGIKQAVSRKWPRKFVPNWSSNPSRVTWLRRCRETCIVNQQGYWLSTLDEARCKVFHRGQIR